MPKEIIQKIRHGEGKCIPLIRLLPNMVTLASLCIALTSIRYALAGDFVHASIFLLVAGFMDGVDGRLARFFNSSSDFGAQLDSLVDFVNFGVTPGFIIYSWINYQGGVPMLDWAMVLFFAICGAIRLARFNVALSDDTKNPILDKYFFVGIPAPVGAAMAMLPMVLFNEFGEGFYSNPILVIFYTAFLAVLMASRIPTISIKKIPIRNEHAYLTLILLTSIIIGLIVQTWITLAIIGIVYFFSIPITFIAYKKIELDAKRGETLNVR
jgi:CDP-diacylglycerol--serine O-phosphatidyltransferase